ncbi:MAG: long-chain fatty acid--CoA ligase [Xylophilus ampelinus]
MPPNTAAVPAAWPRRVPRSLPPPAVGLWDNLAVSARRYPDKPAIEFLGRTLSYAGLLAQVERLAAFLQAAGVRRGDRVVLDLQNSPQLVAAHFAILRADAVVVPVNPMNRAEELKHYLADPEARVAITSADLAPELARASDALPPGQRLEHLVVADLAEGVDLDAAAPDALPVAWRDWLATPAEPASLDGGRVHRWADALACDAPLRPASSGPGDLAVLPYTSGTTGLPKGCMHTHASIMHNAVAAGLWSGGSAANVALAVIPMFHITGMVSVMHSTVHLGGTLVVMPRWDRDYAGRMISRHRVTHWTSIPTMMIDLMASPLYAGYDLSSLRYLGGGGTTMPQAVAQRVHDQFGLRYCEGYGLTETAAPSHTNPPDAARQQCLGLAFVGVDARIVDPETLQELPDGESGEIVVHGPQVFSGYWKQPGATAAAFVLIDGKRFFRSGDLGRRDADGYFYMTDRLKRMINASGYKVWPAEVESLMFRHPAVQEACIIASRDSYRGESVKAVVVLRSSHRHTTGQELIDWCRQNMAVYKTPRSIEFVDAMPKSGSGKVMWRKLQEAEAGRWVAGA